MYPNELSQDVTRPSSGWTNDSTFADSAISMGTTTPKNFDDDSLQLRPPSSSAPSLSERLTGLAALAWAVEQDEYIDDDRRNKIWRSLSYVESLLEDRDETPDTDSTRPPEAAKMQEVANQSNEEDVAHLDQIHQHLTTTVAEMRLRQQEQRHIYEMAVQRLDDIAGTCARQKQRIQDLETEVGALRTEHQKLYRDSEGFQQHAEQLTAELQRRDVALQAMSSAVAGLDGWISTTLAPNQRATRLDLRTRGRGRFKTHYYVEVPIDRSPVNDPDPTVEARELRDGITAWVRGFRDVESASLDAITVSHDVHPPPMVDDRTVSSSVEGSMPDVEDWGDFQTASTTNLLSS
jgi:hypothetical protein